MYNRSLVSIIMPFFNAQNFLQEAVESVFAQTYHNWELMLVDDGSTDCSSSLARSYAAQNPKQVHYLEHPAHQNRGISASRNLGLSQSQGDYIAFLDADDVWVPYKLKQQVAIMSSEPKAGMLYGMTEYWYSWAGNPQDHHRDYIQPHNISADRLIKPSVLLTFFLQSKAAVPCINSILLRRDILKLTGQFEDSFRDMYEDQVFYAKVSLRSSIFVSTECWDKYRQHSNSVCSKAAQDKHTASERLNYLRWLKTYLLEYGFEGTKVWKVLLKELKYYQNPNQLNWNNISRHLTRRARRFLSRHCS